jgi:hypothetical protein
MDSDLSVTKVVGFVAGFFAVLAIILVGSYYGGIIGNHVKANYAKRTVTSKVQQRVRTAVFAQSVYEGYFNECAAVKTIEASLDAQYNLLDSATTDADKSRINTNIGGLIGARADAINQYNADAAEYTRGQFLASNLPARLDDSTYEKGTHTTCAR